MLNVVSIAVPVVLSCVLTLVLMVVATKYLIGPSLIKVFEEKYAEAEQAISRGMSALGVKSGESRQSKALEKAIFTDLVAQYPEINMILESFSPDTAAMIEENPQIAAILIERYMPLVKKLMPQLFGAASENAQTTQKYDF